MRTNYLNNIIYSTSSIPVEKCRILKVSNIFNMPKSFEFKAEMKQLLNLIVHSLYTNPEIFLRELVSNSSDALNKVRFMRSSGQDYINPELDLNIKIKLDKEKGEFSIEDTGIGMTEEELVKQLGTIASSGTLNFIEKLSQSGEKFDANMIGQFGVGFYSVFMVTDEVSVETKSATAGSQAVKWSSKGLDNYTIEEIEKETRGTKISFIIKDEFKQFLDDWTVKHILKKYSNFVDFQIFVNDELINTVSAIWQKKKEELKDDEVNEFYKFISNDFQDSLAYLPLNIEGNVNFKALLFIPQNAPNNIFRDISEKTVHLYTNRVFIQDDCSQLLPDYLKFVQGVVDTEDLPLNVSRELIQDSPLISKINKILTTRILNWLESLAQTEKEKYDTFFKNFGNLIKTGVNSDFTNKNKIIELLRFESTETKENETTSLSGYVTRMKTDQDEIYFVLGEHRDLIQNNPKLEYYKKNNIEVLLLSDPVDFFTIPNIMEYEGKKLVSIEKAVIKNNENAEQSEAEKANMQKLIDKYKAILGDKIADVKQSNRLIDSVLVLSADANALDPQMERMMQIFDKNYINSKKVLELNVEHPIHKKLIELSQDDKNSDIVESYINILYSSAQLIDGSLKNASDFIANVKDLMLRSLNNELTNK